MSAQAHAHMEAKREGSRMFNFIHEQTRIHFHACTSSTPLALSISMSMMPGAAFDDPMLLLPSCHHSQNFGGNKKTALQNSKPSFIQPSFG